MSIDLNNISTGMDKARAEMDAKLRDLAADPSATDDQKLLQMQAEMNKWSLMVSLQSSIIKNVGDTLKGIVQKM